MRPFVKAHAKIFLLLIAAASIAVFISPAITSAHENYVLTKSQIDAGMQDWSLNVWSALDKPGNLKTGLGVALGALIAFAAYLFFYFSRIGLALDKKLQGLEPVGHAILRITLAASFIASAYFNSFLGPEIPLSSLPAGAVLRYALFALGIMLALGIFTEIVGIAGLAMLVITTFVYKDYMLTYFNYFGEFVAFIFFGSRIFSLDKLISGIKSFTEKYRDWEVALIRVTYGISVLYPAITIKILHPIIMVEIAETYHLADIHWLFPPDPLLISLGTGLTQIAVGLLIIFGLGTRLSSFVTFMLYILSIIYFKEAVWPHYILLALALYLVINDGGKFTIDEWLKKKLGRA